MTRTRLSLLTRGAASRANWPVLRQALKQIFSVPCHKRRSSGIYADKENKSGIL